LDLVPVRFVVLVHHVRDVTECHRPDTFLHASAQSVVELAERELKKVGHAGRAPDQGPGDPDGSTSCSA
jgi:hypothetical protein